MKHIALLAAMAAAGLLDGAGSVELFVVVAGMYVVMAAASLFGPETRGRSLEQISELDESTEGVDVHGRA